MNGREVDTGGERERNGENARRGGHERGNCWRTTDNELAVSESSWLANGGGEGAAR